MGVLVFNVVMDVNFISVGCVDRSQVLCQLLCKLLTSVSHMYLPLMGDPLPYVLIMVYMRVYVCVS